MMEFLWESLCQLQPALEICQVAKIEGERMLTEAELVKVVERAEKIVCAQLDVTVKDMQGSHGRERSRSNPWANRKCYKCQNMGHMAFNCRN